MRYFNAGLTKLFDLILLPFGSWREGGLVFISALTGVLMLLIFKMTSNQKAIRRARDRINAHLLALRLFADDAAVVLASQRLAFRATFSYLRYALVPLAAVAPVVILIMVQLHLRYGFAPARVGKPVVVTAAFATSLDEEVTLETPPAVKIDTAAVRCRFDREAAWRVRALAPGKYTLRVRTRSGLYSKELVAGSGPIRPVSARRVHGLWAQLFNPGERPLESELQEIKIAYDAAENELFGIRVSWVITFFVVSLVAALALKGVLRTEI